MSLFGGKKGDRRKMPMSERLYRRFFIKYHGRYLITDLQYRAKAQSLDYIERHMGNALIFPDRWDLLSFALSEAPKEGLALEFGVADGASLRHLAGQSDRPFHGFDSFEGLPEHWSGTFERKPELFAEWAIAGGIDGKTRRQRTAIDQSGRGHA